MGDRRPARSAQEQRAMQATPQWRWRTAFSAVKRWACLGDSRIEAHDGNRCQQPYGSAAIVRVPAHLYQTSRNQLNDERPGICDLWMRAPIPDGRLAQIPLS